MEIKLGSLFRDIFILKGLLELVFFRRLIVDFDLLLGIYYFIFGIDFLYRLGFFGRI